MYETGTIINKRPSEIRFSQDSIGKTFGEKSGHRNVFVNYTLGQILSGRLSASVLPQIDVAEKDGELYTWGNRRLYIFRVLELKGKITTIPVRVDRRLPKLTTTNDGVSIHMRFGKARDHAHAAPIPKPKQAQTSASKTVPDDSKAKSSDGVGENGGLAVKIDGEETKADDVVTKSDDVEAKSDNVETKDDDVETKSDDVVTKRDDVETKNDNVETKVDDVKIKSDDVLTKADDVESKADDEETKNDDVETKADNVVTKVDDVETKDVLPSFDSDANVFTVEKDRMPSHQLGKHGHVELADTASASEPEAKRSKT